MTFATSSGDCYALVDAPHLSRRNPYMVYCYHGKYFGEWQGFKTLPQAQAEFDNRKALLG